MIDAYEPCGGRTSILATADVEAMVRLVAEVCDPAHELTVADRRNRLVKGLADLVGADMWVAAVGVNKPEKHYDSVPFAMYDGGWRDEQERIAVLGACMDTSISEEVNRYTAQSLIDMKPLTWLRADAIPDETWSSSEVGHKWRTLGFDNFMISIFPMENLYHSVVGLHRRWGQPPFSERDRTVVHVIWQQVEWLHRKDLDVPVGTQAIELSVRERQVLLLLLGGKSRREAAETLGLSEYTVGDYVKSVYRKLSVNSRAELFSKFTPTRIRESA